MAVALFLLIIVASFVIVRFGAVALELTGLPWEQAKFQALSAFSNSGFTTREAERVTRNPVRRQIVSFLIVLGNAGLITLMGTFVSSLAQDRATTSLFNIVLLLLGVLIVIWFFRRPRVKGKLRQMAKRWLERRYDFQASLPEEMLHLDEGYQLTRITLGASSQIVGRSLAELKLKQKGVQILAIEREGTFAPIPRGDKVLNVDDTMIVYGRNAGIKELFKGGKAKELTIKAAE